MRILAAISGGVDSAVAAARLVARGADVVGVHLRTGVESDGESAGGARSCCGADDARDARAVASRLGIPFYVVDVQEAFGGIVDAFVSAYAAGRTPIPCVDCNKSVKFGRLREIARGLGAGVVATGHYARLERAPSGRVRLLRAADERKDQTYMLHQLDQEQLASAMFPIGDTRKGEVRAEAGRLGFAVAGKPDSQELCFVPAAGHRAFLRERDPDSFVPGAFEDEEGRAVAAHEGAMGFTIGQRRGLPAVGEARYVKDVEPRTGRVTIAPRAALMRRTVLVRDVNWIDRAPPPAGTRLAVAARHRHAAALRRAQLVAAEGGAVRVAFDEPVFALTPGQALVAYAGDAVLCGGTIHAVEADD
jgi:tRNA-specific 2-thiouridylase